MALRKSFRSATEKTINTKGVILQHGINIRGDIKLANDIHINGDIKISSGTFTTDNYDIICTKFDGVTVTACTINLGSSEITCSNQWILGAGEVTFDAGTSIIKVSGSFDGRGYTYHNVEIQDATVIYDNNTYNNLKLASGKKVRLFIGTTQTITSLTDEGAIIESTTVGNPATLKCTSGTIIKQNGSLKDITATGGATLGRMMLKI